MATVLSEICSNMYEQKIVLFLHVFAMECECRFMCQEKSHLAKSFPFAGG